ncbi:isochorismatase family protein, partial [Chloroflexota bacterium]
GRIHVTSEKEKLDKVLAAIPPATLALEPFSVQAEPESVEIDLQRTAVVVIDMQNCFVSKGGMFDLWGWDISVCQKVIEPIKRITTAARAKGMKVVNVAHIYNHDLSDTGGKNSPNWYKDTSLPSHREHPEWGDKFYIDGTWGADIIDELKPQKGDLFVVKPRYSAFWQTNLHNLLQFYSVKYLIFMGVATNVCVEHSLRDAYNYEYFPILISDASGHVGPPFTQDATITNIQYVYGWVATTENILKAIEAKE